METFHEMGEIVYLGISVLGALVVIWGVIESFLRFVYLKFTSQQIDAISESDKLRQRLGAHLLLGLEIFIGADIISSVVSPSWRKVGILGAIVAIRIVLNYFLTMELRQTKVQRENT